MTIADARHSAAASRGDEGEGVEERFDAAFVARLALREKQVQQSYRPVISIHKWFARRPGTLFRSLLLAEFGQGALSTDYFLPHRVDKVIADPFMGGGTTIFEALRLGLSVVGSDVNPMSYWLVRQAVEPLNLTRFQHTADQVVECARAEVEHYYRTACVDCGADADVKYFMWVKTCLCPACGTQVSLFPGYRVAEAVRHPREVYHCPGCDCLREVTPGNTTCPECHHDLKGGTASRGKAACPTCDHVFTFSTTLSTPPEHRLFAIEYHCPSCYRGVQGRQFKTPDTDDHARFTAARQRFSEIEEELDIPDDAIPPGDETSRLLRWGYRRYRDMFTDRQLLGLGVLMKTIRAVANAPARHALATVFSDFLRYQNLLCRYDTYALKCQDIFSVHGFPVGLIACENNLLGIAGVGSGSFVHFVAKYVKAKSYTQRPYETVYDGKRKRLVPMLGESIEADLVDSEPTGTDQSAWLSSAPSQELHLVENSLDGVFTDPPYYANVQYAELMDFCYVWLRKILRGEFREFAPESTRTDHEITGNATRLRGQHEFTQGLSSVFQRMAFALKPGAPLIFTYHHNDPLAYVPLVVAILDARLTCTAVLPAPAEMAASLHIAGTKSSILDSVFVCRDRDCVAADSLPHQDVQTLVKHDVESMRQAGYEPTTGDQLCLRAGHVAALAVRQLTDEWNPQQPLIERHAKAASSIEGTLLTVEPCPA